MFCCQLYLHTLESLNDLTFVPEKVQQQRCICLIVGAFLACWIPFSNAVCTLLVLQRASMNLKTLPGFPIFSDEILLEALPAFKSVMMIDEHCM